VLWCAALATIVISIGILTFGTDIDTFRTEMRQALERIVEIRTEVPGSVNRAQMFDFFVAVLPAAAAVVATTTNTINLWLAARIVKFSGRLHRPWPHLPGLSFPGKAAAALAIAIGLTFIGGIAGLLATVASAALVVAYGVLGFAVLHAVTRNARGRGLVLGIAYASVILFFWPIFALCLLGLADTAIDLRGRVARRGGPPAVT
jgi:hypothetical protein